MLIPFGVLSAAGAGGGAVAGSYDLIATTVLGSNQASVVFDVSTYASTYKHLQIRAVDRQSTSAVEDDARLLFNGSQGTRSHLLYGAESGVFSYDFGTSGGVTVYGLAATATANNYTARVIDILDAFSTTKNKTIRMFYGNVNTSNFRIGLESGFWNSTDSITSLTLAAKNNYVAGSRFSIYGIKG